MQKLLALITLGCTTNMNDFEELTATRQEALSVSDTTQPNMDRPFLMDIYREIGRVYVDNDTKDIVLGIALNSDHKADEANVYVSAERPTATSKLNYVSSDLMLTVPLSATLFCGETVFIAVKAQVDGIDTWALGNFTMPDNSGWYNSYLINCQ